MRQFRSATASNFVPMPPGRFHPHRHLRVTPRHRSVRSVASEGRSRSLERSRRHDDEEMSTMAEEPKRDPVRSLSNRIFLTISGKWLRAYSIVRHVGRTSGPQYHNPVSAYPLGDGSSSPSSTGPSRTGSAKSWPLADSRYRRRAATTSWNGPRSSRLRRPCPPIRPYIAGRCGHATSRASSGRTGQQRDDRRHRSATPRAGRRRSPRRHSGCTERGQADPAGAHRCRRSGRMIRLAQRRSASRRVQRQSTC